jgi:hypothetical protein
MEADNKWVSKAEVDEPYPLETETDAENHHRPINHIMDIQRMRVIIAGRIS